MLSIYGFTTRSGYGGQLFNRLKLIRRAIEAEEKGKERGRARLKSRDKEVNWGRWKRSGRRLMEASATASTVPDLNPFSLSRALESLFVLNDLTLDPGVPGAANR